MTFSAGTVSTVEVWNDYYACLMDAKFYDVMGRLLKDGDPIKVTCDEHKNKNLALASDLKGELIARGVWREVK